MEPHSITAVHPIWRPGDVVLDGNSNVRVRSDNPRRLLVRAGKIPDSPVVEE